MRARSIIAVIAGIILVAGIMIFGWKELNSFMFSENPQFTIKTINVETEEFVSGAEIKRLIAIKEGDNIFSFSSSKIRESVLNNIPTIKELYVQKIFPDKVSIKAFDRKPVLKLGENSYNVVDNEGHIFTLSPAHKNRLNSLPLLTNGNKKFNLIAGQMLNGTNEVLSLSFLNLCQDLYPKSFRVSSVDISHKHYMIVQIDNYKEARILWNEMTSDDRIKYALHLISEVMKEPSSSGYIRFDVSIEDKKIFAL